MMILLPATGNNGAGALGFHKALGDRKGLQQPDYTSPYTGGVQLGSPEPPFKISDIHSMHVVEVLVYTHLLALIHINYETEIDIDNVCKMFLQKHPRRMENSSLLFL